MRISEEITGLTVTIDRDDYSVSFTGETFDDYGDRKNINQRLKFYDREDFDSFLKFFAVFRELERIRNV